ncbi:Surface antigen [Ekhidna lutea]|uniref:Surface antigen n=1 Tax=Ekhidna lutea TaxID=447679 RepID=A0A239M9E4_EKHLU|nr:BamA/TamA family outer membrane protein [Ekhidna lutea]SNT39355.1 Surface antigen [Ekhidna lutea]
MSIPLLLLRILSVIGLIVAISLSSHAQETGLVKRVWNSVFNDTTSIERPKFIAYPTVAYAPETKWELGVSAVYVYYANQDIKNRLSEINAFSFITLEQQYGLWMDHALYSDKSKWFFLGRIRLQQFPLLYFGVGPDTDGEELAQIDAGSISIRERVLRKVYKSLYLGFESDFHRLSNVSLTSLSNEPYEMPTGLQKLSNIGLGLGLVYDSRHNVLNVREGFFGETGFLRYDDTWGSDFEFTSYFFDARYYLPVTSSQVFASQVYFSEVQGNAPFSQLSLMGGESLMRGYYLGRYRDQTLLAAQTEYRFLPFSFSERWGAAAFVGAGTVSDGVRSLDMSKLKVAGGTGVRFLIFRSKDIFTRFDVAFSEDGLGYYFFIGEAF